MKINKLAYLLCLGLAGTLVSCSDTDKEWEEDQNTTSSAVVEFESATVSFKENKGLVDVPLVVTGDQNGRVTVEIAVESVAATEENESATEDVDFLVTSKKINIGSEDKTADVEIDLVDDDVINLQRAFKLTITSANGASIGTNSSCIVYIRDNDSAFYEKLMGTWTMNSVSRTGATQTWTVTISGADEGEEGYEETLYVSGIMGYSWAEMELEYAYDMATGTGTLTVPNGSLCALEVGFTSGDYDVYYYLTDGNGRYTTAKTGLVGNWSQEDFNYVDFTQNAYPGLMGLLFDSSGSAIGYWFNILNMTLTR